MKSETTTLSRDTLHEVLLPRVSRLRQYAHRKIPSRFASTISVDDILQEVWVAVYRNAGSFTPDGPDALDRWLMTITNSKLVDAIRNARRQKRGGDRRCIRNAKQPLSSFADLFTRIQSQQKTPSRESGATESAHAVFIALNHLRADRRQAVYMRHIQGCSCKEIARAMDKSDQAVNSLIYNGLLELRSMLGDAAKYFSDYGSSEMAKVE